MKNLSIPKDPQFKVLQYVGTFMTVSALILIVVFSVAAVVSFVQTDAVGLKPGIASMLFMLGWGFAILVLGRLFHWLVAMKATQDQIIKLLEELRDNQQHN